MSWGEYAAQLTMESATKHTDKIQCLICQCVGIAKVMNAVSRKNTPPGNVARYYSLGTLQIRAECGLQSGKEIIDTSLYGIVRTFRVRLLNEFFAGNSFVKLYISV